MNRSKLIPILKSLSKNETKEFDKFLNSPFFGCKNFVLNFYRALIKFYPAFNEKDIAKNKLFRKLYKNKKYNDALMRRMISDLIRFSEEYLMYKNFKAYDAFKNSCILNELSNRNLGDQFRIRSENILKKIQNTESIDPKILLESYLVNLEVTEFRKFIRDTKMHESFTQATEVFIVFFLRLIYSYINHTNTFSNETKFNNELISSLISNFDFNSFLKQLENNKSRFSDYLKMVFYVYNIVSNKNDRESYFKLNELVKNKPEYFSISELKNIYISIIKFYNYQNENFDNIFLDETFKTYNIFLKNDFLPESPSKLQISFCRNYINLCKSKNEINHLKIFSKKFADYFPDEYKKDLICLCEAVYFFEHKNFEKSLSLASKVNVDKEVFKKDIKILKLKNYYELGYYESVYSELDNLKHLFSSSKSLKSEMVKKGMKFTAIFRSIVNLKTGKSGADLFTVKKHLEKEKKINEKNWLLEKISELE